MVSEIETRDRADDRRAGLDASKWLSAGAIAAAIGASLCCVGPFVLVLLGLGGSWMSLLAGLSPYRPIFVGLTLGLLVWAFHKLYLAPCPAEKACASSPIRRRQRILFWLVTVVTLGLVAFPWYAPWFLD